MCPVISREVAYMPHYDRPSSMSGVCHGERLELCRWVLRWVPIVAARSGGVFGRPLLVVLSMVIIKYNCCP